MTRGELNYLRCALKPNYEVTLEKKGRAHYYKVVKEDKEYLFAGVTGVLGIIGGEKMNKLIGWAKKEALKSVERELRSFGATPILMEPDVIAGILARATKKPAEVLDAAADYGTRLHDHCDRVIQGLPLSPEDDLENSVLAFQDWFRESGIEIIMGDTAVASIEHGYGGKFDAVGVLNGKIVVIDYKTSSGIREEYALQVAAYGHAFRDTYGMSADLGLIVRFDKATPTYEIKWIKDMDRSFEGFLAAKKLKEIVTGDLYS